MNGTRDRLGIGNGGWVRYERDSSPVVAHVRFEDRGGRLASMEEYLRRSDGAPITAEDAKDLPRRRIGLWANEPSTAAALRARLDLPGPDLRRAASHFATTFGAPAQHWVAGMMRAQLPGGTQPPAPKSDGDAATYPTAVDAKLNVPSSKRFPDDFYRQVLDLSDQLKLAGAPAGKVIAAANGVPHARARQWITEGRRRTGRI